MNELGDKLFELRKALKEQAELMRRWAGECRIFGWSTQLVEPMRRQADLLDELLIRHRQGESDG